MSKIKIVFFLIVTIIVIIVIFFGYQVYYQFSNYPKNSPQGEYVFVVEPGATAETIATQLQKDNVIYRSDLFLIREKLTPLSGLQVGEYTLILPATPVEIIKQINAQSEIIRQANLQAGKRESITVLLREGLGIDDYTEILFQAGVIANKQEFLNFAKNPNNFDRQKFAFLPTPLNCEYGDITTCAKYYPEGYLYPDTYQFFLNSSNEEVFNKLLSNFNTKVWSRVQEQVEKENVDFHKVIILASVLEKETGRTKGIKEENLDEVNEERKKMAQVFYNRLKQNMKWQSDVTIEYGTGRKVCQQTFEVPNCFLLDDPIVFHKYNTYLNAGYPIGPVTNPQFFNIYAALNPIPNNYLFFVSDATGKKYFAENFQEHEEIIREVNRINRNLGL